MLSYKYHEWSTETFDTIKISSYFLLKMNKFSLVTGLNCPELEMYEAIGFDHTAKLDNV